MRTLLALAMLAQLGAGVRRAHHSSNMVRMADVPVYNFDLRHLQTDGLHTPRRNTKYMWILTLEEDTEVIKFCVAVSCSTQGHTDGVPYASVAATTKELMSVLDAHASKVAFAEPDIPVYVPDDMVSPPGGDGESSDLWHLDRVGKARTPFKGQGTHIYVMDTGVRSTHQDFGGRAIPTLDTIAGNGVPIECNGDPACATDSNGHGTHVASTAAGTNYGVAPEATIHIMKVCCGAGTNVLGGMDWIIQNAPRPAIMTVSLASQGRSETSLQAVNRVVNAGIIVTVGAANDNVDTCTMTYGFIPSAISVGATDSNNRRASFSNWGTCNDIYAPGVSIVGAWNDADDGMRSISGTSMATPMAAGAAALLLEQDPTRSPEKVANEMKAMSIQGKITDLQPGDPDMLLSVI